MSSDEKNKKPNSTIKNSQNTNGDTAVLQQKIEQVLSLLDGAKSQFPPIAPELEEQRKIASDITKPLEERLEAYEDIIDSEIGDTNLTRARNIEREFGLRQIFLKFEGTTPTGTQKDRIAFAQIMDALRRGYDTVTVATCGNYGAAISLAASIVGIHCEICIPEKYHPHRFKDIENTGARIIRIPGDYEEVVAYSQDSANKNNYYDANAGGENTLIQFKAYAEIANEIYDELRDAPAVVALPVSNGTTLAGIYKGFVSLYRRGKTSKIPKFVAGSAYGKNPIIQAFLKNSVTCENLSPEKIRETAINEPLINWRSIDGDYALTAIRESGGWASYVSDKNMMMFSKLLREKEGLSVLPASTAGLIALLDKQRKDILPNDRYVVVLTGRK
ncbi:MAG: pyridoxal-phosphate dependent enzyme [Thermoplasmatota archaeon]